MQDCKCESGMIAVDPGHAQDHAPVRAEGKMDQRNRRILIIDDNRSIHEDFRKILVTGPAQAELAALESRLFDGAPAPATYDVDSAFQGEEGYEKILAAVEADRRYALVFVDMRMPPGWDGMQTIEKIWDADPEIQIVICTAFSDYSWEDLLARFGAADRLLILKKPFDTAEVCQLACALTEKWHLAKHAHLRLSQMKAMVAEQTRQLSNEVREHRRSTERLRISEDRYALAAAAANDGLWDWNLQTNKVFYSPRWKEMLGLGDAISDAPDEWLDRIHPDDVALVQANLQAHFSGQCSHFQSEYRIMRRDARYCWMLCRGLAVRDDQGRAIRIAASQTDITDRKVAEQQLRHAALHDALTGLANRTTLMDRLHSNLHRLGQYPSFRFAVLFLDLDRFKGINDSLGHLIGDELLVATAARLGNCLEKATESLEIEESTLFRIGGDEFVALLIGLPNDTAVSTVADQLQAALAQPFSLHDHEVFISCSIGVALANSTYQRAEEILRDADTAMYQAKAAGKSRFAIFGEQMHATTMARWRMENELRGAIEHEELILHYQPIISLASARVVELEALVRWQHPQRGLVAPMDFIPLTEETGMIVPIGMMAMRMACNDIRRWSVQLPEFANVSVGVNISGKQLLKHGLADDILQLLLDTGVGPHQLRLEITETSLLERDAESMAAVNELCVLDLRLQLDDFGTGYSSLSYLHRLPLDALKIDRSFIASMDADPINRSIVQAIVSLAHSLNLFVIAEGIETPQQVQFLRSINCDYGQGFYFSKPLPAPKVAEYLISQNRPQLAVGA